MHKHTHKQGNLQFAEEGQDNVIVTDPDLVKTIASLLACSPEILEKALCFRTVGNKLLVVEKGHTLEQANYGRDAFAKVPTSPLCSRQL